VESTLMDARSKRIQDAFEWPMLLAALLVIPVVVADAYDVHGVLGTASTFLNWLIWSAFVAEAIVMLSVVPDRGAWLTKYPLDVAIVLFTAPLLPATLQAARVLRLVRILRLARLARSARAIFSLEGLKFAAVLSLVTLFGGGAGFVAFESHPGHHLSLWDGVWWAATTMTTVGYGDIYPTTVGGRIVALVVMTIGIGFIALLTGAIAQRFLSVQVSEMEAATGDVALAEAEILAEIQEISQRLRRLEGAIRARQQPNHQEGTT
jgi:voltage-gated potassium channel